MRRVERSVDLGCCGRRAVKRCIGAKESREGARDAQQKETIAGSGSLDYSHTRTYYTVGATQLSPAFGVFSWTWYQVCNVCSARLRGWHARSHTERAAHRGYVSCRKQR